MATSSEIINLAPASADISRLEQQITSDDLLTQLWLHGRSAHTQRAYAADVTRFQTGIRKPFTQVSLADLQTFADSLGSLAPASQYRILSAVKSLLAFGHRVGYLAFDVGRILRLPVTRNRLSERILAETEVLRMLALEPQERNRTILELLYASGIRVSELCGICWRDLQPNGSTGQVTVFGKGGQTRSIQLPQVVWSHILNLRDQAGSDDPVFRSRKKGGPMQPAAILHLVRKAAERASIHKKVSPHWLRHAHASHALDNGAPIHLVQATLGHSSITTTGRYLHARPHDSSSRFLPL